MGYHLILKTVNKRHIIFKQNDSFLRLGNPYLGDKGLWDLITGTIIMYCYIFSL